MPLFDQDGRERESVEVLTMMVVRKVRVEHSRVVLFGEDGAELLVVARHHDYPGQGLDAAFAESLPYSEVP